MKFARLVLLLAAVATAAGLAPFSAAQTVDTTPPTLDRGEIDGGTVTLYFSEALDPNSVGGTFRVQVSYRLRASTTFDATGDVAISGNVVTVGLGDGNPGAAAGSRHNFLHPYSPPTDPTKGLRDLAGNAVKQTSSVFLHNVTGPPVATDVAFASDAGADRTYLPGDEVRVRLTFREAVAVTGTPRLKIDFSSEAGDEQWADYADGSGTKILEFVYTVVDGDASGAGVAVLANTLELNGGTIESGSSAGENAELAHAGLAHDRNHRIGPDETPPTVVRGEIEGGTITLFFSKALDEDSVGGTFSALVHTAVGSQVLFSAKGGVEISGNVVTVGLGEGKPRAKPGLPPADHHSLANLVQYSAPTDNTKGLQDLAGNEVRDTDYLRLDNVTGVALTVTGVEVSSDAGDDDRYGLGEKIRVRLTFSKAVIVTGTPWVKIDLEPADPARWYWAVDERWAAYADGSGTKTLEFVYTVAQGDASTAGVEVVANTLNLDGGTIRSVSNAGENAALAHAGLAHDPNHKVEGTTSALSAASVDGNRARLAFDRPLSRDAMPRAADFRVAVQGSGEGAGSARSARTARSTAALAVEGAGLSADDREVVLTLSRAAADGERLTVGYVPPSPGSGLRHADGNPVAAFSVEIVVSDAAPSATGVAVVSDPGDDATYAAGEKVRVAVTFDQTVDVDTAGGTPRLKLGLIVVFRSSRIEARGIFSL